jgi:hypothetical protein
MAADLHVHIMTDDISEDDLCDFFSSTMGTKWFNLARAGQNQRNGRWDAAYQKITKTPRYNIGEVSWLKAAILDDSETFVPGPVQAVHEAIGDDLPTLDDGLIDRLVGAMTRANTTGYTVDERLGKLREFLEKHKGSRVFTVSW